MRPNDLRCMEKMQPIPRQTSEDADDTNAAGSPEEGARPLRIVPDSGNARQVSDPDSVKMKLALSQAEWLAGRQALVIGLAAELLDAKNLEHAAANFVNVLHQKFSCSRVVLGLAHQSSRELHIAAISQQAIVEASTAESRLLIEALNEAIDVENTLNWPAAGDHLAIADAHRRLSAGRKDVQITSVPMFHENEIVGAVLLERQSDTAFAKLTRELLEQLTAVATPILQLHTQASRSLRSQCRDRLRRFTANILGPDYLAAKCLSAAVLLTIGLLAIVPVNSEVLAEAEVVARERRIVSAPSKGFIESINTRAGDRVVVGQLLLTLDTRDLVLQAERHETEIQSAEAEFRASMAAHDRKAMAVAQAELARARAERSLVQRQIERATVRSEIDGYVINDVLEQAIGSPVARGDVLLEVAPEAGKEIHLLVHENDIADVRLSQRGELALAADPGEALSFVVTRIHPVAEAGEGQSRFRVTASLDAELNDLRSGQTGLARLSIGTDNALSVATHRFTRWFQQQWWAWFG